MNTLDSLKAKTAAKVAQAAQTSAVQKSSSSAPEVAPEVAVKEEEFQAYKSTIDNQRIAMPNGKVIYITVGKYITKNPEEIEFLDYEISQGFPYLQKAGTVTASDLDPMSALRKKFYAEFLAAQAGQGPAVPAPVLGDSAAQPLSPVGTDALAALAAGSSSPIG